MTAETRMVATESLLGRFLGRRGYHAFITRYEVPRHGAVGDRHDGTIRILNQVTDRAMILYETE